MTIACSDAVLADVLGKFLALGLGGFGVRVLRVFADMAVGDLHRSACSAGLPSNHRRRRRSGTDRDTPQAAAKTGGLRGFVNGSLIQQIELDLSRLVP